MPWPNETPSRRSTVLSRNAAVATNDPTATQVGLQILKDGGNAADAAIGIAAVLNLVDPGSTGLGGDCFCLFYDNKSKTVKGINGSGRTSSNLTEQLISKRLSLNLEEGSAIPCDHALSITVPGAAAGWIDTVETFGSGKLTMNDILQPAINLCENGYPVHKFSAYLQRLNCSRLKTNDLSFGDDLLEDGRAPNEGDVICNKHLADVYKKLGSEGKAGFYEGDVAKSIVDTVNGNGGCMSLEDLASHKGTFDDPIHINYKGINIWEMPPNGQGLVALIGLNILEELDLKKPGTVACFHQLIEATRLAFHDGIKYICDPSKNDIPIENLLSKEYATARRSMIEVNRRIDSLQRNIKLNAGDDTVYFSVVDQDGNACSFINSIYHYYGSGYVPKNCGFALQCRASGFSLDPSHPNFVGPNKRSYHTIIPGMATHADTGELYACFGNMGAFMQPQGHIQLMINLINFNFDPQAAICYPRFQIKDVEKADSVIYIEETVDKDIIEALKKLGHNMEVVSDMKRITFGRAQIIQVRKDQNRKPVLWSGSESRTDGCAMGY